MDFLTTEYAEHTEREPAVLCSDFRVFCVVRGSIIGSLLNGFFNRRLHGTYGKGAGCLVF